MLGCSEREAECAQVILEMCLYENSMVYVAPSLLALAALSQACILLDSKYLKSQRPLFFSSAQLSECWNGEVDKTKLENYMRDIRRLAEKVRRNRDMYPSLVKRIKRAKLDELILGGTVSD